MPTLKKKKAQKITSNPKKSAQPVTSEVVAIKQKGKTFMPVPEKMLKTLKLKPRAKLYWTAVDGILQLSTQFPVLVIPMLDRAEEKFEAQK